jgi:hypothetical protein
MSITNGGLNTSGFRLDHMISLEINRLLSDTANLRNSPFLQYAGSVNGLGTDTIRIRKYSLGGRDLFKASANEDDDEANDVTDPTVAFADIAVARQYLVRQITDLGALAGYGSADLNPFNLASDMALSYEARFAELTADTASLLSDNTVGSASVDMTVDLFFQAISALQNADSGRGVDAQQACMVLHPVALNSLQDSLRSESNNAVAMMSATADMLEMKGKGYIGKLFGVDIYKSSFVNENTGAHENFLLTPQCIAYADGIPTQLPNANEFMQMGKILVEMQRQATSALSQIVGHAYIGFGIVDGKRGVKISTSSS